MKQQRTLTNSSIASRSDNEFKDFKKLYKDYTKETFSIVENNTFRKNLL